MLMVHVGNWQVAMTSIESFRRVVYLLMRPEDNMAMREALNIDNDDGMVRIIQSDSFLGGVVDMVNALNRGHLVSIMGDRAYGRNSLETSFIGGKARFPYAALAYHQLPDALWPFFVGQDGHYVRYFIDMSHIIEPPSKKSMAAK
ncbi:MAG: LpxL/LpxP family acyltransferase [Dissulfurimicrobium sp.]|uniref:LpxL/LpxP family acyltransferase n=1 Tax=Dissulfurimicrobium sp. TaxID=2022436 RepID=UPI004048EFAB